MKEKVCVITSVRNCLPETKTYLDSLRKFPPENLGQIVLIDDGSERETNEFLRGQGSGIELYLNPKSRGFAFSNNLGAANSNCEWLLFMNNDLVLRKGWSDPFDAIISGRKELASLGCAGNVQLNPVDGRIDHAGVTFSSGIPEHFLNKTKDFPHSEHSEFLAVTGACLLIRRELFMGVGGFDESYKTGFEDIDLCLRLSMLGFRNYVLNRSVILHKRSSTPERNQFQKLNSEVFYGRWGRIITRFQEWENAKRMLEGKKGREKAETEDQLAYVLQNKQNFLFADRKLLDHYFNLFRKEGKVSFAEKMLEAIRRNYGAEEELQIKKGKLRLSLGQLSLAEREFSQVLKENPGNSEALLSKGEIFLRQNRSDLAIRAFKEVNRQSPGEARSHVGISRSFLLMGREKEAEKWARLSTLLDPSFKPGWHTLANLYQRQNKIRREIRVWKILLNEDPRDFRVVESLIAAYAKVRHWPQILLLCRRYFKKITKVDSLNFCSRASYEVGDFDFCKILLQKVLKKDPENSEALMLRGNLSVAQRNFSGAVSDYAGVLTNLPDSTEAFSNLVNSKSYLCEWSNRAEEMAKLGGIHEEEKGKFGVFEAAGLELDEKEESENAQTKAEALLKGFASLRERLQSVFSKEERSKKRVGFVSSDFRNHAVGHLMIGLLENLDHEKYEIVLFATSPPEVTEIRERFQNLKESRFVEIHHLSLVGKATAIKRESLDLLIDLGGFSQGHNAELLALRPALRQAHFLGYASTMGKGLVDYLIADKVVVPPSSSKFYGESLVRMDGCFFPPGDFKEFAVRVKRKEAGLPSRGFVYCAFHAAYKLEPEIWSSWMRILKAVPESVLWLKFKPAEEAVKNLKSEAIRHGVASKRIIMAEDLEARSSHLSRMAVADLYLDCPKYNGHASAMDALHAKLPILTIKGNRFCNRVGESFCKNLGLDEMIARDIGEYEKKAIELGLRPTKLLPLRKKIAENATSVLSPKEHAARFEDAVDRILRKAPKSPRISKPAKFQKVVRAGRSKSLADFTLLLFRPVGISNWARNANMLAEELAKWGGQTLVVEPESKEFTRKDFSKTVRRIEQTGDNYAQWLNFALSKVATPYVFCLDDPLRALPATSLCLAMRSARDAFDRDRSKIGYLGIGSKMEPHAGVLVTEANESKDKKIGGLFAPCFALNFEVLKSTGGFKPYGDSLVLSCLDLALRMEEMGFRSTLIESENLLCPVHSGRDYLRASGQEALSRFARTWKRKPASLRPKRPPVEQQVRETADYQEWIRLCDTITEGDILSLIKEADELQVKPLISVIMPVFDPPKKFLIKAIESVLSQAYGNWELCIADDASTKKYVCPLLESYARRDSRIKVTFRKTNGHISVASNSALKLASGEFVAFLDHDDELRPHALLEVAKTINKNPDSKLIYSDEDKIDEDGKRFEPYFKPDWNPDLLLGQNYISHLSVFKTSLLKRLKGLRKGFEGSQDWDLALRFSEQVDPTCIVHVPKILYHWRAIRGSAANAVAEKQNIVEVTKEVILQTFDRRAIKAEISFPEERWNYPRSRFQFMGKNQPKVSILIPTKDRVDLLEKCISSILTTVGFPNMEIIIVDNQSSDKATLAYLRDIQKNKRVFVLKAAGEFNYSRLNNLAAAKAKGRVLLLLNNDIEAIERGWFEEMLAHATRPEIGCVGAKLLYPDGRLQHGGVIVGLGGGAGHSHKFARRESRGYSGHLCVARNTTAVTAACLMIRKELYLQAGGLDESSLKIAFNDVDFCLRVQRLGHQNFWTPFAELIHHESASRGDDHETESKRRRSAREILALRNRWNLNAYSDPLYNVNLTHLSEQYWFGIPQKIGSSLSENESYKRENIYDSGEAYRKLFKNLSLTKGKETKFLATGGRNREIGSKSLLILREFGLKDNDFLVDVGCGYGRLTEVLRVDHVGKYLGTEVVPELLNYARTNFGRKDWKFELVDQQKIPAEDESADMVCFFSIFTHLLHEQSFIYLKEVKRILKVGGKVVFSFLDFKDPVHIPFFEGSVSEMKGGHPLNVFMSEDLIRVWSDLLGFECLEVLGPEEKKSRGYPFSEFGQSIACLKKVDRCLNENKPNEVTPPSKNANLPAVQLKTRTTISKKREKRKLIQPLLKKNFSTSWNGSHFDCMPRNAEQVHGIIETENISDHEYDGHAIEIIQCVGDDGSILDCGSGRRPTYYANIVNFDPVAYDSTDVVGVGENLPFNDNSFDAVFSLNVLEHVRDPFACAKEIIRVLKPGGQLYCVAPLLTPYHGYPDHYYNMTKSGLRNLFQDSLNIRKQDVLDSGHPIFSLTWILNSWVEGLNGNDRKAFLNKRVKDLRGAPQSYLSESFVKSLSLEKKFEIGATTALWAEKKNSDKACSGHPFLQIRSKVFQTLSGKGLEIGAFEHPAELPNSCEVKYFDRISTDDARTLFPEVDYTSLNPIDYTGDLDRDGLAQFQSDSFDFVIINHVLEHVLNPIHAIRECFRILKNNGSLVISIPDKRFTFDRDRKLTDWGELFDRFRKKARDPRTEDYEEIFQLHPNLKGKRISKKQKLSFLNECKERREHLNVWDSKSFKSFLLRVLDYFGINFSLLTEVQGEESQFEYLVHLQKIPKHKSKLFSNITKTSLRVFSLHIPKCGGTSFKKCLIEIYGENFISHYPELEIQGNESLEFLSKKKCIHGHLLIDRYQELFSGISLVTWLRDPVLRTISLYYHISANPDPNSEFHNRVHKEKPSISEFCEMPENQNQLFYWIGDRNPDDFKFIGFLETAKASIVKCAAALGWSHVPQFPWENRGRFSKNTQVSRRERELIRSKNLEEIEWIEKAKRIFG